MIHCSVTNLSVYRSNSAMMRGFTLIELLVVMVILALVMGITAPILFRADEARRLDAGAAQLYDALRRARAMAVMGGRPVTLDARSVIKDSGIKLESAVRGAPVTQLTYFPDGSADSARFSLSLGAARRNLAVDWLTGHAALAE